MDSYLSVLSLLASVYAALIPMIILGVIGLLLLGLRTNYHIKRDVVPSPRRGSATLWSLCTLGFSAWGGVVRLALANSSGMDEKSALLRKGAIVLTVGCSGLSLISDVLPSSAYPGLSLLANLLGLLPLIYLSYEIKKYPIMQGTSILDALIKSLTWFYVSVGLALLYVASSAWKIPLIGYFAAPMALIVLLRATVHFVRLLLLIGIEAKAATESEQTRKGGFDFLCAIGYFIASLAVAAMLAVISYPIFR